MLEPLQRLGDFEIIRLLGKGGMGEVYEARQSNPERRVALKILAPWLSKNDDALERFWREAKVPAQLDHPGVVRIISTGKSGDLAYYAMQLVRGISLADLLRKANEPLPETVPQPTTDQSPLDHPTPTFVPQSQQSNGAPLDIEPRPPIVQEYLVDRFTAVARIGLKAAKPLAAAHRQGILHRDIKPSNLMIDHHDELYIMDFGLTRALSGGSELTRAGTLVGTPWFMSPEQARGEPIDARSDLFSLGVTLYQLASRGDGPYTASRDDSDAVLQQVRAGQLEPIDRIVPEIPARLASIITKMVEPDLNKRYQRMEDLAKDLERFLEDPDKVSRIAGGVEGSRRGVRIAAGLLLGAALVVLAVLLLKRDPRQTTADPEKGAGPTKEASQLQPVVAQRPINVRMPLFRADNQPANPPRRLLGAGTYTPLSKALFLQSVGNDMPTLLALDDLTNQSFEYSVEMKPPNVDSPGAHRIGIFFGWRERREQDPIALWRFFSVELDKRPVLADIHGRLVIGTDHIQKGDGFKGNVSGGFHPMVGKGWIPLPKPMGEDWYKVAVRVVGQQVSVMLNDKAGHDFDVAWLRRTDPQLKGYSIDPRGVLGIWARNGHGYFRNPTVLLHADESAAK